MNDRPSTPRQHLPEGQTEADRVGDTDETGEPAVPPGYVVTDYGEREPVGGPATTEGFADQAERLEHNSAPAGDAQAMHGPARNRVASEETVGEPEHEPGRD